MCVCVCASPQGLETLSRGGEGMGSTTEGLVGSEMDVGRNENENENATEI